MSADDISCYWEKQGADKLCAVHCVNSLLQGPYFSEVDLGRHAVELDDAERRLLQEGGTDSKEYKDWLAAGSSNADNSGNFSIGVIEATLRGFGGISCVNMQHPDVASVVQANPSAETGYICNSHSRQHWFTIRRVRGDWWNLDSLKHSPERIGDIYLAELLRSTKQQGFTVFVVRGDCPLPDPSPSQFKGSAAAHQYFLTLSQIEDLKREGRDREQREMDEAQRLGGGGAGEGGNADESSSTPAFKMITPADKRKQEVTDWNKLGGGQTLGGGASIAASADPVDAELQAALRISMQDPNVGVAAPPEEPEPGAPNVCTLQVRLPSNKRLQRRFLIEEHLLEQVFAWLEHASVEDSSLGIPLLTSCDRYALMKRGFPGGQTKIEKDAGAVRIGEDVVGTKTLKECGFQTGQEAVVLQL